MCSSDLNFHLQLFLFWQIFDVKGRHFRPRLGAGTAVEVERLEVPQTRARPELTTLPAHPASAGGDSLPQGPDDVPSRQPCLASQDLKTPALFQVSTSRGGLPPGARGGLSLRGGPRTQRGCALRCAVSPGMLAGPAPAPDPATPAGHRPGLGPKGWS